MLLHLFIFLFILRPGETKEKDTDIQDFEGKMVNPAARRHHHQHGAVQQVWRYAPLWGPLALWSLVMVYLVCTTSTSPNVSADERERRLVTALESSIENITARSGAAFFTEKELEDMKTQLLSVSDEDIKKLLQTQFDDLKQTLAQLNEIEDALAEYDDPEDAPSMHQDGQPATMLLDEM